MKKDVKSVLAVDIQNVKLEVIPESVLLRMEMLKKLQKSFSGGIIIESKARQLGRALAKQLLETQDINYDKP